MQLKIYLTYRPLGGDVKKRTSSKSCAFGRSLRVEADQRKDSIRRKLCSALQKGQLDHKGTFHNRSAELGNQFRRSCRRAPSSDQIIGNNHTGMIRQSIYMNLKGIGAVLEGVARLVRLIG